MMKRVILAACLLALVMGCQSKTETEQPAAEKPQANVQSEQERLKQIAPEMRPSDAIMRVDNITASAGSSGTFQIHYSGSEPAKAMVVPLRMPAGMYIDSVSWDGSVVDYLANKPVRIANEEGLLLMAAVPVTEPPLQAVDGLFATIFYTMGPEAKSGQITETIAPPANQLSYVDTAKTLVHINFDGGKVTVQ